LFFNGLLLISNGIQGEYIARIFEEVKGRPLYVVGQKLGFDQAAVEPAAPLDEQKSKPRKLPRPTKPPPIPRV
jgi:hypothetical protein